jgi:hypothetical protein
MFRLTNILVSNNIYKSIATKNFVYTNMLANIKKVSNKNKLKESVSNIMPNINDIDILD